LQIAADRSDRRLSSIAWRQAKDKCSLGGNSGVASSSTGLVAVEEAGRKVIAVNPRFTSQRCSACGHVAPENRNKQKFACVSCGFTEHADINAARNILRAGLAQGGSEDHLANAEPVNQ
jgi:putative transposase